MRKYVPHLIIGGVLAIAIVAGVLLLRSRGNEAGLSDGVEQNPRQAPALSLRSRSLATISVRRVARFIQALKEIKQQYGSESKLRFSEPAPNDA